jgi:hypothetical protein
LAKIRAIDHPVRSAVIMAQPASATTIDAIELAQPRWSPRRRATIIVTFATVSWALPVGLVYGLSRIFL